MKQIVDSSGLPSTFVYGSSTLILLLNCCRVYLILKGDELGLSNKPRHAVVCLLCMTLEPARLKTLH